MVGYLKTALVFFIDIALGSNSITPQTGFGIACTLIGLAWYTIIKVQTANKAMRGLSKSVSKCRITQKPKKVSLKNLLTHLQLSIDKASNDDDDIIANTNDV